jgi:hypothetical protein
MAGGNFMIYNLPMRALAFPFLLIVITIINLPAFDRAFIPRHDTMYSFEGFYFFYNEFLWGLWDAKRTLAGERSFAYCLLILLPGEILQCPGCALALQAHHSLRAILLSIRTLSAGPPPIQTHRDGDLRLSGRLRLHGMVHPALFQFPHLLSGAVAALSPVPVLQTPAIEILPDGHSHGLWHGLGQWHSPDPSYLIPIHHHVGLSLCQGPFRIQDIPPMDPSHHHPCHNGPLLHIFLYSLCSRLFSTPDLPKPKRRRC